MNVRNPRAWMWAEACQMLEQAERLHRQFFVLGSSAGSQARWEPPVDLIESADEVEVIVALPGVAPTRVNVSIDHGALRIEAVRPPPLRSGARVVHRLEVPYGRFERRIKLPPGRYELIEQACADGCLTLRLAKR